MKKCPQCGREYDNTMMFCLDDGAELLYGPATSDEVKTAILPTEELPGEQKTKKQIANESISPLRRAGKGNEKTLNSKLKPGIIFAGILAVISLSGYLAFIYWPRAGKAIRISRNFAFCQRKRRC